MISQNPYMPLYAFLPLWLLFMNENGGFYFTITPSLFGVITLSVAMVCLLQLTTKCQQIIHKPHAPYMTWLFHARCMRRHTTSHGSLRLKFDVPSSCLSWAETVHKTPVLKILSCTN